MEPLWVRVLIFLFNVNLVLTLNAVLFTDEYIEKREKVNEEERVIFNKFV